MASGPNADAAPVVVDSKDSLIRAVRATQPGAVIKIALRTSHGGNYFAGFRGASDAPIVIEAADAEKPRSFRRKKGATRLTSHAGMCPCDSSKCPGGWIFYQWHQWADEGSLKPQLSAGLRFEKLVIENTGPKGNHDALKLSVQNCIVVTHCVFRGWGGSGNRYGRLSRWRDHRKVSLSGGAPECSQSNGVQMKGGLVEDQGDEVGTSSTMLANGQSISAAAPVLPHFRPLDANWEASGIEIAGNGFIGSLAPIAWVGIDGGYVHHNTIYLPEKWFARILQENTDPSIRTLPERPLREQSRRV